MPDPSFRGRLLDSSIAAAFRCGRWAVLLMLGVIFVDPAATGCVSLNAPDDCTLPCDADGCPGGLVCHAGMCVRSGSDTLHCSDECPGGLVCHAGMCVQRCELALTGASGGADAASTDASMGGSELVGQGGAGGFGGALESGGSASGGDGVGGGSGTGDSAATGGGDSGPPPPSLPSWLAYISTASGSSLLHLFDPISRVTLSFPKQPPGTQVTDFQFSPNGRYLAFRVSLASGPPKLHLLSAPDWTEAAFGFGGVTQYAWSPDSRVLAVAYDGGTLLGGAEVFDVTSDAGVAASAIDGGLARVTILMPIGATVTSKFVWFTDDAVAFHTPNATQPSIDNLYFAKLVGPRFAGPSPLDQGTVFPSTAEMWPGQLGLYTLDPSVPDLSFYFDLGASEQLNDFRDAIPDPGGIYAARTADGNLQVFKAAALNGSALPWAKSSGGCERILAWAQGRERIACAISADAGDQATFFDIDGSNTALGPSPIHGTSSYGEVASASRNRAFSFSGDWFAFTTDSDLFVASFAGNAAAVVRTYPLFDVVKGSPAELAFSPDETLLLQNRGGELTLHQLKVDQKQWPLSNALKSPATCTEDFLTDPDTWCGNPNFHPQFTWSPNSRFIAAKTGSGSIQVWDFSHLPTSQPSTPCDGACDDEFQFQP